MIEMSHLSLVRTDAIELIKKEYGINLQKETGWLVEQTGPNEFRLKRYISKGIMSWTPLFYQEGKLKELEPPMHT